MSIPTAASGKSHSVVFKYSNDTKTIGLVIPDITQYSKQIYTPFAPQTRQGEATQRDFSISSTWELMNDWSGGTGHLIEEQVETTRYAFAQGVDLSGTTTIGPTLFTSHRGRLYPPAAETVTAASIANFKQFIEFSGKLYGLTSDAAGKVYENDGTTTWTLRETLTAAGTQLYTNGTTLYACQGGSNAVRTTTDGTTWSNGVFNAHFIATREENNLAYITTATLTPGSGGTGPSYQSPVIDLSGTTATNMVYHAGRLWIGKPEGLTYWEQGWVYKVFDTSAVRDTSNFKWMCVHKGLLWFNVKNKIYFTTGEGDPPRFTGLVPEDLHGFTNIDSMAPTSGPLLIGARMQSRSYLLAFEGVDHPGLNPMWSDADAARPVVACGGSDLFNSRSRFYFSQTSTGTVFFDMKTDYTPYQFHTKGTTQSYVQLTPFTAGFRSVPKWFYEVVLNVESEGSHTFAQVWYSIDGGTWTQMVDEAGSVVALTLNAMNKACYFPISTQGVTLELRIYVYSDDGTATQAYITAVTVRGVTMVKPRYQFSFPVNATRTVRGNTGLAEDSGRNIKAALEEIQAQKYPFKFQDVDGNWHLVLFRTPYPLQAITGQRKPNEFANAETDQMYQVLLVQLDELDASGNYKAWTAG